MVDYAKNRNKKTITALRSELIFDAEYTEFNRNLFVETFVI